MSEIPKTTRAMGLDAEKKFNDWCDAREEHKKNGDKYIEEVVTGPFIRPNDEGKERVLDSFVSDIAA